MPQRIPLWMVGVIAGLGVIAILGLFFYGSYTSIGAA